LILKTKEPMRHLIALLFASISLFSYAQIDWDFPYNPDSDNDGYIYSEDLLDLLAIYGQEYSSDELYISQDSSSLIVNVGELVKNKCYATCLNIDGNWDVIGLKDVFSHYNQLVLPQVDYGYSWNDLKFMWTSIQSINSSGLENHPTQFCKLLHRDELTSDSGHLVPAFTYGTVYEPNIDYLPHECWCVTHQRPRVEYKVLQTGGGANEREGMINEAAQEGWILMPATTGASDKSTFWRWAE